ncbi:hypothetical protein [Mycobacterium sp. 48b]|uniref:hypothetical protein n=1 Tax=Mycobacterium sp. 48b TaxID=3400426 RepID=UPI003AB03EA7
MTAVIGFQVQCVICPQQALVDEQPDGDWTCPRCAEVTGGFGDVDVAAAERPDERQNRLIGGAIDMAHATSQPAGCAWDGDEWWLNKVRG